MSVKLLFDFWDKEAVNLGEKLVELYSGRGQHEHDLSRILAKHLIQPLIGGYFLCSQDYGSVSDTCDLGMGLKSVWHGWPDMIAKGNGSTSTIMVKKDKEEEEESKGDKSVIEVKWHPLQTPATRHQALAQAMVFSFIQHSRHPA